MEFYGQQAETDLTGKGFYKLENGKWTNYNTANTPDLSYK